MTIAEFLVAVLFFGWLMGAAMVGTIAVGLYFWMLDNEMPTL